MSSVNHVRPAETVPKLSQKKCLTSLVKSLEKVFYFAASFFLVVVVVAVVVVAASIRPPERTLRHSKTAPNCGRNRAQTYPQKLPNAPSEFLEKISLFLSPAALVWWLQTASIRRIRLPEGTLRHSKSAPNCVPKPCSNLPTKTA